MSQSINLYNQLAKNKLFSKSVNFDLKRIKLILKKLNHPERKLKNVINIIGSDGKRKLLGDVDYDSFKEKAGYLTPVPGGVGPMTIHCLLSNTFDLALKRRNINIKQLN